jgi:hypothetical protein
VVVLRIGGGRVWEVGCRAGAPLRSIGVRATPGAAGRAAVPCCMALRSAGSRPRPGREMDCARASAETARGCGGSVGAERTPVSRCTALRPGGSRPRQTGGIGRARASVAAGRTPVSRCMALRSGGSRPRLRRGMGRVRASVVVGRRSTRFVAAGRTPVSRCAALRSVGSRLRRARWVRYRGRRLIRRECWAARRPGGRFGRAGGARRRGVPDQGRRSPRDTGSPAGRLGSPEAPPGADRDENSGRKDCWSFMPCSIGTPCRRGKGAPGRFRRVVSRRYPEAH